MTVELIPLNTYLHALNQAAELRAEIERLTARCTQASTAYMLATNRAQHYEAEVKWLKAMIREPDIEERLREYARNCGGPPEDYLTWQAADEIKRLREGWKREADADCGWALQEIERLTEAIRTTASEGTYDEIAIRKAVSFELAELIVDTRRALKSKP